MKPLNSSRGMNVPSFDLVFGGFMVPTGEGAIRCGSAVEIVFGWDLVPAVFIPGGLMDGCYPKQSFGMAFDLGKSYFIRKGARMEC